MVTVFQIKAGGKIKIVDFQFLPDSALTHSTTSYRTACMLVTHFNADSEYPKNFGKRAH